MRNLRPAFLLLLGITFTAACGGRSRLKVGVLSEGEVVEAVGEVMIDPANPEDTKKRALVDAQKNAIAMVVGVHLTSKTLVEKSLLIQSNILARTEGYIRKYEILKEWQELPLYKTRIRAYVSAQQIVDDLKSYGILKEPQVGYPRVAILLSETAPGAGVPPSATPASDAMAQALLDKGYHVVDRSALLNALKPGESAEIEKGNLSSASQIGAKLDAEVLILGTAQASLFQANGFGGLVSYRSSLNAKALHAKSGTILLTISNISPGLEATPATAAGKALAASGTQSGADIARELAQQLAQHSMANLSISGVSDLNYLKDVEKAVSAVAGADDYYLRSFGNGEALLEVHLKEISPSDLASALEKNTGLKLKILGLSQNTIQAQRQP